MRHGDVENFARMLDEQDDGILHTVTQDKVTRSTPLMDRRLARVRQHHAVSSYRGNEQAVALHCVHRVGPDDVLAHRRAGVQLRVLLRLRHGDYLECDYLDLHGLTLELAYARTLDFISSSRRRTFRCVLIIHGKGRSQRPQALLKSHVAYWLQQLPEVLAYHSAPPFKGGTGALLVFLKKDEKAAAENFERHARRRR